MLRVANPLILFYSIRCVAVHTLYVPPGLLAIDTNTLNKSRIEDILAGL